MVISTRKRKRLVALPQVAAEGCTVVHVDILRMLCATSVERVETFGREGPMTIQRTNDPDVGDAD